MMGNFDTFLVKNIKISSIIFLFYLLYFTCLPVGASEYTGWTIFSLVIMCCSVITLRASRSPLKVILVFVATGYIFQLLAINLFYGDFYISLAATYGFHNYSLYWGDALKFSCIFYAVGVFWLLITNKIKIFDVYTDFSRGGSGDFNVVRVYKILIWVFIFQIICSIIMWVTGAGVKDHVAVTLPFKLTGLVVRYQYDLAGLFTFYIMMVFASLKEKKLFYISLAILIIELNLNAFVSRSKGPILELLVQMFIFFHFYRKDIPQESIIMIKKGLKLLLLCGVVTFVLVWLLRASDISKSDFIVLSMVKRFVGGYSMLAALALSPFPQIGLVDFLKTAHPDLPYYFTKIVVGNSSEVNSFSPSLLGGVYMVGGVNLLYSTIMLYFPVVLLAYFFVCKITSKIAFRSHISRKIISSVFIFDAVHIALSGAISMVVYSFSIKYCAIIVFDRLLNQANKSNYSTRLAY